MIEPLRRAREAIAERAGDVDAAVVLGSGLGGFADALERAWSIPYADIPHMPVSTVSGHAGRLVIGECAGRRIAALQGRVHLYEGRSGSEVAFAVRLVAELGAGTVIITNAAGGIAPKLEPGDLMAITDQLNLTGTSSLDYPGRPGDAEPFVDMTAAFDSDLIAIASRAARGLGFDLPRGVYAGLRGPAYETPAEVRMLRALGADAVGMSTVLEVLAARHLGLRVLGLSCISNLAAGIADRPLRHAEVKEVARRVRPRFESLLAQILEAMEWKKAPGTF